MGVSGSGKTTVGLLLADDLGWPYFESDDYHPPENVRKMARGEPLTDADRRPWLNALRAQVDTLIADGASGVITCSALKAEYRRHLGTERDAVRLVYLKGDYDLIRERMEGRSHFFKPELLRSQFEALEEPAHALVVSIDQTPDAMVREIREALDA